MTSIVALDIETTGLDPQADAIIEIGAVRFNDHRVESEWSSLINPNRSIPPFVTQLTKINDEMVRNAPTLSTVIQQVADFAGDDPIVGHNVRFDLSFLQRKKILMFNEVLDTYELASVLMPSANRYNLGALGAQLGVLLPANHRALDDARVTHAVFIRLKKMVSELPIDLLAEFVRMGESIDWGAGWVFQQALKEKVRQSTPVRKIKTYLTGPLFQNENVSHIPVLKPVENPSPLDVEEAAALLEHGGQFSRFFENYEYRPQQLEMLKAIANALSKGQHFMVEAGTGIGKSFAYLVPAALWATRNNTRVMISTNTINLQDQLIKKDIPDLRQALGMDLRATVLKGRANYLCPRRLESIRQHGPETVDELRVLAKVLMWLEENGSGDRNEINLNGPAERDAWMRISAEDEGCKAEVCVSRMGGACPFYRSRQEAQNAHLVVINHALLLSDVATGSRILPDYNYLIVDEAHHLEAATTNAMSFRATQGDISRLMRELGSGSSGMLGRIGNLLNGMVKPSDFAAIHLNIQRIADQAFHLDSYFQNFFHSVEDFLIAIREERPTSTYSLQVRILPATRTLPGWTDVEIAWDQAETTVSSLGENLSDLIQTVSSLANEGSDDIEDAIGTLASVQRRLVENQASLSSWVNKPDANSIYWAELQPNGNKLSLQVAPLHIGPMMEQYLWHEKNSIILTSATLTTHGEFDYLRNRLGADEADELALGSPFDFENSSLLYLVNDIPEPSDTHGFQHAVDQILIHLSKATGGKLMALFTSYAQLKKTSKDISQTLGEAEITVYEQGEGASPNTLLENFRGAEKAVLLGTRAFWEGVDIPGEALSVLVIVKLPFDVPSDPIVAARSETFDDPFNEYSLPEAILRFRQGFGRLIRTQSDRGIVAILDRRILTKKYGRLFIESLPQCKVQTGSMLDLPRAATRWLNQ